MHGSAPSVLREAEAWFTARGWRVFDFQREVWKRHLAGENGMINAPTGSGKTYALMLPILAQVQPNRGVQAIWITPIRALAKEIHQSATRAAEALQLEVKVAIRTGDTPAKDKAKMRTDAPHILITTPETLHLLLAQKGYAHYFKHLQSFVVDEWHELIGSKRGVQIELALSRLKRTCCQLRIWGISATIGNMHESVEVLMGDWLNSKPFALIRGDLKKQYAVESVFPEALEVLPWAGHLGVKMLDRVVPILMQSRSTLIFLNTRGQAEIWYQKLLEFAPELAGVLALHHGSMSRETRHWVEDALHDGRLKAVICTSSLDLGVDFRPVETIIQVGSPKGVARFIQRAGRSGHSPGAVSRIYFVPTHSLELVEAAALREAVQDEKIEARVPHVRSFDVLIQYLVTLAVSDGFSATETLDEVRGTFCFSSISDAEWDWCLRFLVHGGEALGGYDEFHKVVVQSGLYRVVSRRVAMRHRLSIGTIVSDTMLKVKLERGAYLGNIEEWFVSRLNTGDSFWFAGRSLELVRIKELTVTVRKSAKETGPVPSWIGGRMPLSSELAEVLRKKLSLAADQHWLDPELAFLSPLFAEQAGRSLVPKSNQLLIEVFESKDGHHVLIFPFEGRFVHEGLAALLAYRISLLQPISFSMAMNDYGFELLSDQEIPIAKAIHKGVFSTAGLHKDITASVNAVEMAKRRFRDIASISGLIFQGYPHKMKKERHLQASAQLFFSVFQDHDKQNLLLKQAFEEVFDFQLEAHRLRIALERISSMEIKITKPGRFTPFAFPIVVDRLRERLTSESLADRIAKMKAGL